MATYYENDAVSIRDDQGLYIPIDTANSDYQAYLAWVAEGNTINPASTPSGGDSPQEISNIWSGVSDVYGGTNGHILFNDNGKLGGLNSPVSMQAGGRLTLTSDTPVSVNVASASTLFYTPYLSDKIDLFDYYSSKWSTFSFIQQAIIFPSTANKIYDIFCYYDGTVVTIDYRVWTNNTTRAINLDYQDGVLVLLASPHFRYIGTIYVNSAGVCANAPSTRYVWNMHNRLMVPLRCLTTGNYTYSTGAWREAGGISTIGLSRVEWVQGLTDFVSLINYSLIYNTGTSGYPANGIGVDVTASNSSLIRGIGSTLNNFPSPSLAFYDDYTAAGLHFGARLEFGLTGSTIQWFNASGAATAGMRGVMSC